MKTFINCVLINATAAVLLVCCGSNKKKEIVDMQFHYRDSLGMARAQYDLVDLDDTTLTPSQSLIKKLDIKHRIYNYEWKLDSLDIELGKY